MEEKEKQFITAHTHELVQNIRCTQGLISRLIQDGVLGTEDQQATDSLRTDSKQTAMLLEILQTRVGAFRKLIIALEVSNQTGAAEILNRFNTSESIPTSTIFNNSTTPKFWVSGQKENLIILSHDVELTINRMETALPNIQIFRPENLQDIVSISSQNIFSKAHIHGAYGNHENIYFVICSVCDIGHINNSKFWRQAKDEFTWADLTNETQNSLLERKTLFQNTEISVKDICALIETIKNRIKAPVTAERLYEKLDTENLVKLKESNGAHEIVANRFLKSPKSYMERSIRPRNRLSRRVLNLTKVPTKDIFLIYCPDLYLYQFASFVTKYGNKECDLSENQMNKWSVRCILLKEMSHYEGISQSVKGKTNGNNDEGFSVHLLEAKAINGEIKRLTWVRSVGSVLNIQKYVHNDIESISEDAFYKQITDKADNPNIKPICIVGTPGMGKSSFLSTMARKLQTTDTKSFKITFVQRYLMCELLNTFENTHTPNNTEIIESLCKMSSNCSLGKWLVELLLSTKPDKNRGIRFPDLDIKLELMFDGLEELDSMRFGQAIEIIDKIQSLIPFNFPVRIWATARPDLLYTTEDHLQVLAQTLLPLNEESQIKLLTRIWEKTGQEQEQDPSPLTDLADSCIKKVRKSFESTSQTEDATGNPLFCCLLGKCLKEKVRQNCDIESFLADAQNITFTSIIKMFVQNRLGRQPEQGIELQHMQAALNIMFAHQFDNLLVVKEHLNMSILFQVGILEERCAFTRQASTEFGPEKESRFIHSTFAWYFSALAAIEALKSLQHDKVNPTAKEKCEMIFEMLRVEEDKIVLSTLEQTPGVICTYRFAYPVLCQFLNLSLQSERSKLNISDIAKIWQNKLLDDEYEFSIILVEILMASVVPNYIHITSLVLEALKIFHGEISTEILLNLEYLTAKHANRELMKLVCGFIDESNNRLNSREKVRKSETKYRKSLRNRTIGINKYQPRLLVKLKRKKTENKRYFKIGLPKYRTVLPVRVTNNTIKVRHFEVVDAELKLESIFTLTPLHVAIEAGNVEAAIYLVTERHMLDSLINDPTQYRYLLNACVIGSVCDSEAVIRNKREIINFLAQHIPRIFTDTHVTKYLELESMHVEVLLEYLKVREKLESIDALEIKKNAVNRYGENFIHLLANSYYHQDITPIQYYETLVAILDIEQFTPVRLLGYLYARNAFHWTALDVAVSRLDLTEETLIFFNKLQEDSGDAFKKSKELLCIFKANVRKAIVSLEELELHQEKNALGKTARVIEWISKRDIQTNAIRALRDTKDDFRGSNVLLKAVAGHRSVTFLDRLISMETKAALFPNPAARRCFKETILQIAVSYLNLEAVKFIIDRKIVKVNSKDCEGNTPLHICFRLEYLHLLEKQSNEYNAEIRTRNNSSVLPESHESRVNPPGAPINRHSQPNSAEYFGATVANFQTTLRFYPRTLEIEPNNQQEIIKALIENGAKINKRNKREITPLHLAINICLDGLRDEERSKLEEAGQDLFTREYLTLALKGLLLNSSLGERSHPLLIEVFAKAIKEHGGDIHVTSEDDGASLLHWAARRHSLYGVKYLIEIEGFSAKIPDTFGRTPIDYMDCHKVCENLYCLELRRYLRI